MGSHLSQHVFIVLVFVIRDFWQSYLVSAILVFVFFQIVSASSDNISSTWVPTIVETVTSETDEVWWLIRWWSIAIATTKIRSRLNIVTNASRNTINDSITYILAILRVVLRLLTINQRNSIDVVILMVCILITPHDQILFSFFESNRAYWLGTLARNIDIRHILIRATSRLGRYLIMPRCSTNTNRIAQLALWANSWKHRMRQFTDTWRIIQVYILLILNTTVTMNWRLSPLNSVILFICLTVVAWTVTEVPMIIIGIIIVIRKVIFGGIVRQATLVILNMSSLIWYLALSVLNVLAAAVVVQLHAARWALYLYILVINIAAHRSCYVTLFL